MDCESDDGTVVTSACSWSDLSLNESWDYDSGYEGVFEMDEEEEHFDPKLGIVYSGRDDPTEDTARRVLDFVFD